MATNSDSVDICGPGAVSRLLDELDEQVLAQTRCHDREDWPGLDAARGKAQQVLDALRHLGGGLDAASLKRLDAIRKRHATLCLCLAQKKQEAGQKMTRMGQSRPALRAYYSSR